MKWYDISKKEWKLWKERVNYVIDSSIYDDSVLDKYSFMSMPNSGVGHMSDLVYLQNVIALCNNYPEIKSRIFNTKSKITCEDAYQYTYSLAVDDLYEYIEKIGFLDACANLVKYITPSSLIDYPLFNDVELPKLTEHDVFELLRYISVSTMLALVNRISTTQEINMQIKECILKADEETFINVIVFNRISFDPILANCYSLILLSSIKESLVWFEKTADGSGYKSDFHTIKTPIVKDEVFIKRIETSLEQGEDAVVDYFSSIPQNVLYDLVWTFIYELITKITLLSAACSNYEQVKKFNNIVAQEEILKEIQEEYDTINKLKRIYQINFIITVLEEFKRNFIVDLPIPKSIDVDKDMHQCFQGACHEAEMMKLYRALVNEGILSWDENTCFSFMYRTCKDYKPSKEDTARMLNPIVWNGERRDLFAMVYHLFEDTQLWKKCGIFFLDPQGNTLKIPSGCLNMAKAPTEKMEEILRHK